MPEPRTYRGSCHCGNVRYEVETDLGQVISCNCSICSRTGALLAFTPMAKFKLLSGQDSLTEYRFNKHVIGHLFCKTCGIRPFATGKMPNGDEMRAVNVRCLEDVDLDALPLTKFDGKSR